MTTRFILDKAGDEAEIYIYDVIGEDFFGGYTAVMFKDELAKIKDVKRINVRINSPGGSVFDGNTIYNLLSQHKARKVVDIDGLAASIASVIAMAGDEVRMAENAMFMIHNPTAGIYGESSDLRKLADLLDQIKVSCIQTYRKRTNLSEEELVTMLDEETWMTAADAKKHGFVDSITATKQVAACAGLEQVAEKLKFKHLPEAVLATVPEPTYDEQLSAALAAMKAGKPADLSFIGGTE